MFKSFASVAGKSAGPRCESNRESNFVDYLIVAIINVLKGNENLMKPESIRNRDGRETRSYLDIFFKTDKDGFFTEFQIRI